MKELFLQSYSVKKTDILDEENYMKTEFRVWCLDKNSKTHLIRVKDYKINCKVKLPYVTDKENNILKWNDSLLPSFIEALENKIEWANGNKKDDSPFIGLPTEYILRSDLKELYYHTKKPYLKFLELYFSSVYDMNSFKRICSKIKYFGKEYKLEFCETEEIPICSKFLTEANIINCQKFKCKGKKINEIARDNQEEYLVEYKNIFPLTEEEKKENSWISKPKICSFDIECYSKNLRSFVDADKLSDCIISIGMCFYNYKELDKTENIVVQIGPKPKKNKDIKEEDKNKDIKEEEVNHKNKKNKKDLEEEDKKNKKDIDKNKKNLDEDNNHKNIEDKNKNSDNEFKLIRVDSEEELLDIFCDLIIEKDPTILIGYNIFNFDYSYIYKRLLLYKEDALPNLGKLKVNENAFIEKKSWKSSAYGTVEDVWISMEGRFSVDLLPFIKRDYKLSVYTLNAVSKHFLQSEKDDLHAFEMFSIFKEVIDFNNGKRDYTRNQIIEMNYKIAKYNIQDCVLVCQLFEKLNVWISLTELSSIVYLDPMDTFTSGQQVRCINALYSYTRKNNFVMNRRVVNEIFFEGGKVNAPIKGLHDCVMCFDFNSLYPSLTIAANICFTTFIKESDWDKYDEDDLFTFEIKQMEKIGGKNKDEGENGILDDWLEKEDSSSDEESGEEEEKEKPKKRKKKDDDVRVEKRYVFKFLKHGKNNENIGLGPLILKNLLYERKLVKLLKKKHEQNIKKIDNYIKNIDKYKEDILKDKMPLEYDFNIKKFLNKDNILEKKKEKDKNLEKEDKKDLDINNIDLNDLKKDLDINNINLNDLKKELEICLGNAITQYDIAEARQLAIKVSANSYYGFYGAQKMGKYSLIEGAMVITYLGRKYITQAGVEFNDFYNSYLRQYIINRILEQIENQINYLKKEDYNKKCFKLFGDEKTITKLEKELDNYNISDLKKEFRELKEKIKNVEENELKIVYGDTDSIMISISFINIRNYLVWEVMDILSKFINGNGGYVDYFGKEMKPLQSKFPPPLTLEAEKAMRALLKKKKTYAYYLIDRDGYFEKEKGSDENYLNVKGLLSARREGCEWIRSLFNDCLKMILNREGLQKLFNHCLQRIIDIIELKNIDIAKQLSVIKSIGKDYKNENFPIQKLKTLMASLGKPLANERLKCLYVLDSRGGDKSGDKLRTTEFFLDCWNGAGLVYGQDIKESKNYDTDKNIFVPEEGLIIPEKIDSFYYINNIAFKPIDDLFDLAYEQHLKDKYSKITYREKKGRKKEITCERPIYFIKEILEEYKKENYTDDLTDFVPILKNYFDFYT
jgi:DNA polymerase elongation subunit (family B)